MDVCAWTSAVASPTGLSLTHNSVDNARQMEQERDLGWAEWEFGNADLGDKRRTKRAVAIATARANQSDASLPQSLGSPAEVKAGYRFFENEDVEPLALIAAHKQRVIERVRSADLEWLFAIQDTMHMELGEVDAWAHSTMVADEKRVPYGLIQQQVWSRPATKKSTTTHRKARKVEDKESWKWISGIRAAGALQQAVDRSKVVCVGDRENDLYDAFAAARENEVELLIRSAQDRKIVEDETLRLWEYVTGQPALGESTVNIGRNSDRDARIARVQVRNVKVTLQPPNRSKASEARAPIPVWAIHVVEVDPPKGVEPIEWLLLTTVKTETLEEASRRVRWYAIRWLIEMFHKVLKSGCQIEERQFETLPNFRRYLTIDSVVAWRVLFLTVIGRVEPDMPCTAILDVDEWQTLFAYHHPKKSIPVAPPRLIDAVIWIAKLGGFLGRKSDGQPGIIVIWRGIQMLQVMTMGFIAAKQLVGKG